MPYGNPDSDESLYEDATPTAEAPAEREEGEPTEEAEGPTAILPKSILAGKEFKPGDEVVLEVVSMQGDEVVVKYAHQEKGEQYEEKEAGEMGPGRMASAPGGGDSEMASMMQ